MPAAVPPPPIIRASTMATENFSVAHSNAHAAPTMPPPITTTSNTFERRFTLQAEWLTYHTRPGVAGQCFQETVSTVSVVWANAHAKRKPLKRFLGNTDRQ